VARSCPSSISRPSSGSRARASHSVSWSPSTASLRAGFAIDEVTDVGALSPVVEETHSKLLAGAILDDSGLVGVVDVERLFAALAVEDA